ncbi:MAG: YchJ family protein [Pedobacter sp.]|uniref:YchJ family protein n=1 Tax=Pedobacter sp. TaxID=1411316 RepID=UPI002809D27C|nr:YchJ family protein [Pedobacter sp.]MDQ8003202.1 YchJ family protein [Pedobacter sp.]
MELIRCTCCSEKSYTECCQPFHLQIAVPPSPEHLMRSRYSAYALHLIDYLWETAHPAKRYLFSKADIEQWAKANYWFRLEIIYAKGDIVEFKAFYQNKLKEYVHHEKSIFKKDGDKWYYFSGEHF